MGERIRTLVRGKRRMRRDESKGRASCWRTGCWIGVVLIALIATGVVFFVVGGRMRLRAELQAIRDAGEPVSFAQEAPLADADNAYLYFKRAGEIITQFDMGPSYRPLKSGLAAESLHKHPPSEWAPADVALARWRVQQLQPALREARAGLSAKGYRLDYNWLQAGIRFADAGGPARRIERTMVAEAMVRVADGDIDGAAESCADAMKVGDRLAVLPGTMSYLVRSACEEIALGGMAQVIYAADRPEQLHKIQRILNSRQGAISQRQSLIGERVLQIQMYDQTRAGTLGAGQGPTVAGKTPFYTNWMLSYDEAAYLSVFGRVIGIADTPYYQMDAKLAPIRTQVQNLPWYDMLAKISLDNYTTGDMLSLGVQHRVRRDVLRTAVMIRLYRMEHGKYPDRLLDLPNKMTIDEYSGRPLIYAKRGGGFVIYSVGMNLIDDGGVKGKNAKSGDIVFEMR